MAGINHEAVKDSGDTGTHEEWNADHVFTGNPDMGQHYFLNQVIEQRTTFPAGPVEGQVIFRTDENKFYVWNGTEWVTFVSPATIVVAADGSGHTTNIQTGINLLPIGGGVVYIKEGTYTTTAQITFPNDNIALIGAGKATEITCNAPFPPFFQNIVFVDKGGVIIRDVFINGNAQGNKGLLVYQADKCSFTGLWITDCTVGIYINDVESCYIEDCDVYANSSQGIYIVSSENLQVIGNSIYSNGGVGVQMGAFPNYDRRMIFCSNVVYSNTSHGVNLWFGEYCVVNGNEIYSNGGDGIQLQAFSDNNVISSNYISGNTGWGLNIAAASCDKNIVMVNIILGNTAGQFNDAGTDTHPNGASGTNNLAQDDLNIIA